MFKIYSKQTILIYKKTFFLQISDSFRKFGLGESDTSVFVVILNDKDGSVLDTIKSKVDGTIVPLDQVSELTDSTAIKKVC